MYKNIEYPVKSESSHSVGDTVRVSVPCNNWDELYIQGSKSSGKLSQVQGKDTSGILGTVNDEVISQELIDAIANRVMTELVPYANIANNFLATDQNTVLSGPMGKSLKEQLDQTNSNFDNLDIRIKGTVSYQGGSANANDFDAFMTLGSGSNYPDSGLWYIMTLIYNTQNKKQVAYGYRNNNMKSRYCDSGTWSNWV